MQLAMSGSHTDIMSHWLGRAPAAAWRPYALLLRLDRPIGAWLLFLPGLWGLLLSGAPAGAHGLAGAAVRGRQRGDARRRLRGERHVGPRPGPAGRPHRRPAARLGCVADAAGGHAPGGAAGRRVCWCCCNCRRCAGRWASARWCWWGCIPLAKRVTWWPQLVMGFTFGFGAPMGYAAGAGRIDWPWAALYAAAILWDLGFDTIYAHQDREDDALAGVRSTARLLGERHRGPSCWPATRATIAGWRLAGWLAGLSRWFFVALPVPAALLLWQVIRLDIHDPAGCLRLFRLNREAGLAIARQSCSAACDRGLHRRPHRARPGAAGARDRAAPGDRDHADLAGHRGVPGPAQYRAAVLGVRLAGQPGHGAARAGPPGLRARPAGAGFRRRRRPGGDRLRHGRGRQRRGRRDRPGRLRRHAHERRGERRHR